jgi:hypothetical protein
MLRASHSLPFRQIWIRNGNQVWVRAQAEPRMDLVVVEVQAFAIPRLCLDPLAGTVTHGLKRPVRLNRRQHADQPVLDVLGRGDLACDVLMLPAAEVRYCTGRSLCRASDNEASLSCSVSFRACAAKSVSRTCTTYRYDISPLRLHKARIVPRNTNRSIADSVPMTCSACFATNCSTAFPSS